MARKGLHLVVVACALCIIACVREDRYNPVRLGHQLHNFQLYLEELRYKNEPKLPDVGSQKPYPVNVSITHHKQSNYVLPSAYWAGFQEPESLDEGRYFASFMYNEYRFAGLFAGERRLIQYISNGDWYVLVGLGPDDVYETQWLAKLDEQKTSITMQRLKSEIAHIAYDPTNGLRSRGDVVVISNDEQTTGSIGEWRTRGQAPQRNSLGIR